MVSGVVKLALLSRFVALAIQVITNWLITDHEASAFRLRPLKNPTEGDKLVHHLFEGFNKWDGSYFLTVSEDGYSQPQMFVFFPLFPAIVRSVALVVSFLLGPVISFRSCLMTSSWLVNTALFVLSTRLVVKLAERLLKDANMAIAAGVLFCINPASVFMSATYSEGLFSALTVLGMLAYQDQWLISSAFVFGLSSLARSNGIVSFGFLIYYHLQQLTRNTLISVSTGKTNVYLYVALQSVRISFILLGLATLHFGPFVVFQMYSYGRVCHSPKFTFPAEVFEFFLPVNGEVNTVLASSPPDWCQKALPLPYSNIQAEVWDVGLFNYFQLRKIPNFVLALPVIVLSISAVSVFCRQNWEYIKWIGFLPKRKTWDKYVKSQGFFNEENFLHLSHLLFLLIFGTFFMHIEVLTRFLFSSCPILLLFASHLTTGGPDGTFLKANSGPQSIVDIVTMVATWFQHGRWSVFVLTYFIVYFIVGLVTHCNFLPWT